MQDDFVCSLQLVLILVALFFVGFVFFKIS